MIGKDVLIFLGGFNHTLTTDNNGEISLPINLLPGNYTAEISFAEDEVYLSTSANANVVIGKIETNITTKDVSFIYDEPTDLVIALKDRKGNPLIKKDVLIYLGGQNHTAFTDNEGKVSFGIDLLPGNYTAEISFKEDEVYLLSSASAGVFIDKIATYVTAKDVSFIYDEPTDLVIALKDRKGNPLIKKDVLIYLGGQNHTLTTDKNGMANLTIDLLPGNYTAEISFAEDNVYLSSFAASSVVIGKVATGIVADDISYIYDDPINLTIALKDRKGNALNGKNVLILLGGTNYTLTTDNNGLISLPVDLLPGNYTAEISYAGDDVYISSSASANVFIEKISTSFVAKDISVTYGDAANLIVTLKDRNGNVLVGQYVTINLNNKVYTKKTDATGKVNVNVNLAAKTYTAKIAFAGDDVYKSSSQTVKVVVKKATPKLTASSKIFKANAKTKKVTVTLKNKNKAIKSVLVKLTVNKKTYKVKTNSKGVATFKIKLTKKGKFNAVYKFAGNSNFKSATKKVKIIIK